MCVLICLKTNNSFNSQLTPGTMYHVILVSFPQLVFGLNCLSKTQNVQFSGITPVTLFSFHNYFLFAVCLSVFQALGQNICSQSSSRQVYMVHSQISMYLFNVDIYSIFYRQV